jgi:hypothetical protein
MTTPHINAQDNATTHVDSDHSVARGITGSVATNLLLAASFLPNLEEALRIAALFLSVCVSGVTIHSAVTKRTKRKRKHHERNTEQH